MSEEEDKGASNNERLLAAARDDNEEILSEIFEKPDSFDINSTDGLGNTALHLAVSHDSMGVLEHILSHEQCDVDPQNRIEGATPLHLAVKLEHDGMRRFIVESLLDAGADTKIKDKNGDTAQDLVYKGDEATIALIKKAELEVQLSQSIDKSDIIVDEEDVDSEGSESE